MEDKELITLINQGENQKVEFKENIPRPNVMERLIISMANSGGGHIFIGVGDSGEILGVDYSESHLNKIREIANSKIIPAININYYKKVVNGKNLLIIDVPNATQNHFSKKTGAYYKRVGDHTIQSKVTNKTDGTKVFTENGTKSYIKRFDVPDEMHPGDEIIKSVLDLRPHKNTLKITFLWGDKSIKILGAHMLEENIFEIPPDQNETSWYLKVCVDHNIPVDCDKQVYINVEEIKRNTKKYWISRSIAYLLIALSFLPLIISLFQFFWREPALQLTIANIISIPLPLTIIISFILLNKKVTTIIERLSNVKLETNTKYVE
ncbi:ATP-binding protein, partial [Neobacillus drentensis]|uniref:AlbA family DNA-binding domain-containing protein n=1 Tax=Neobacillus drentensis TaxID=220684 RepID=UPI003003123A